MLQAYRHPNEQLHQQWNQQSICTDTVQLCITKPSHRSHIFWKWHQLWRGICGGIHMHVSRKLVVTYIFVRLNLIMNQFEVKWFILECF